MIQRGTYTGEQCMNKKMIRYNAPIFRFASISDIVESTPFSLRSHVSGVELRTTPFSRRLESSNCNFCRIALTGLVVAGAGLKIEPRYHFDRCRVALFKASRRQQSPLTVTLLLRSREGRRALYICRGSWISVLSSGLGADFLLSLSSVSPTQAAGPHAVTYSRDLVQFRVRVWSHPISISMSLCGLVLADITGIINCIAISMAVMSTRMLYGKICYVPRDVYVCFQTPVGTTTRALVPNTT
ncbi:hypothetical protein BKA93DRAFT_579295 [Sparassis latifolia]